MKAIEIGQYLCKNCTMYIHTIYRCFCLDPIERTGTEGWSETKSPSFSLWQKEGFFYPFPLHMGGGCI
jgi:hypothetical protein